MSGPARTVFEGEVALGWKFRFAIDNPLSIGDNINH